MTHRNIPLLSAAPLAALLFATSAVAQPSAFNNPSDQQTATDPSSPHSTSPGTAAYGSMNGTPRYGASGAGASQLGATGPQGNSGLRVAADSDRNWTADAFNHAKVRSQDGRDLGSVRDFLVDPRSGRVDFAVVSSGGWLGIGDQLHLVPFAALQPNGNDRNFTVPIDENTWKSSPGIEEEQFEEGQVRVERSMQQEIAQSFHAPPSDFASDTLLRASKIRGREIIASGQNIGSIEGIVIHPGQPGSMALIDPDDQFAGSSQNFLVPLDRLQLAVADDGNARANLTRADFESAAGEGTYQPMAAGSNAAPAYGGQPGSPSTAAYPGALSPHAPSASAYGMQPTGSAPDGSMNNHGAAPDAMELRVVRAGDLIGTDVISSDGRKVGDIVDYLFDAQAPRLEYVLVMTGGFLDIGGDIRPVPARALSMAGDTAHLRVTRDQFFTVPKMDRRREESINGETLAAVDRVFQVNRTPNGAQPDQLLSFSALKRSDAYSRQSGRLGYIDDVWINLNQDRAPFIEITPTLNPFELPGETRYAIPMARLQPDRNNGRTYTFAISADELVNANPVSEVPGVEMENNGFLGNQVLRVNVGTVANAGREGANQPTGYRSSASATGSSRAASAAQQVRQALDQDAALRDADIRVTTSNDEVLLQGTVSSDSLRQRAQEQARNAASGVGLQNQIQVRNQ